MINLKTLADNLQRLFSLEWPSFERDLTSIPVGSSSMSVPDTLREEFKRQGFPLSAVATIRRPQTYEWQITDQGKIYIVRKTMRR